MKATIRKLSRISLYFILSLITVNTFGQVENYKLDSLIAKSWMMDGLTDKTIVDSFTKDQITSCLDNNYIFKFEYYLSDSIVTVFDVINVGNILEGKYIIYRPLQTKGFKPPLKVSVLEILFLTSNKLILRSVGQQTPIEYLAK